VGILYSTVGNFPNALGRELGRSYPILRKLGKKIVFPCRSFVRPVHSDFVSDAKVSVETYLPSPQSKCLN